MANLITVVRLGLLFIVVWFIYWQPVNLVAVSMILIAIVFAGDGLDGYVARWRGSTSRFGAIFDIATDRAVEQVLWVVFADVEVIAIWVPILVVTRGTIVDALRSLSYSAGMTAFGDRTMMRSSFTYWLTAGRLMRALYGSAKALSFIFLAGLVAFLHPASVDHWIHGVYGVAVVRGVGWFIVWLTVALTIIRGLPVMVDSLTYLRETELRRTPEGAAPPNRVDPDRAPGGRD